VQGWRDLESVKVELEKHLKPILESWIGGYIPLHFST
jgi:hypothetical protein